MVHRTNACRTLRSLWQGKVVLGLSLMGAARRLCVRAVVLAGMISVIVSLALPACQFPEYRMSTGGSGGAPAGGVSGDPAGAADGGVAGGEAGESGDAGAAGTAGSDGGTGGTGGAEPAPVPCPVENCVPKVTGDWQGPYAFWDDVAGAPDPVPVCPEGYAKPMDLHHGIDQPMDGCQCTCTATDQVCNTNTTLNIYDDQKCEGVPCGTVSPLTCEAVSGCIHSQGSLKAAIPTPSGGFCKDTISPPTPAAWQYDSRLCSSSGASVCEDSSRVCAPPPTAPYLSKLCVTTVISVDQAIPECPAEYSKVKKTLYKSFADNRSCTPCGCSAVTGGSCSGSKLSISAETDCSAGVEYKVGAGCTPFTLIGNNAHPTSVGAQYMLAHGDCKVVSPSATMGTAPTIGSATVVCCQ